MFGKDICKMWKGVLIVIVILLLIWYVVGRRKKCGCETFCGCSKEGFCGCGSESFCGCSQPKKSDESFCNSDRTSEYRTALGTCGSAVVEMGSGHPHGVQQYRGSCLVPDGLAPGRCLGTMSTKAGRDCVMRCALPGWDYCVSKCDYEHRYE